jgi:hypothetical protein
MSWQIPLALTGLARIGENLVNSFKRKKLGNHSQADVVRNPASLC